MKSGGNSIVITISSVLCANYEKAAIIMVTDGCLGCHEKLLPKFSVLLDEAETTVAHICNAQ